MSGRKVPPTFNQDGVLSLVSSASPFRFAPSNFLVPSAYLPPNFDPTRPVALIAGRGLYPAITAAAVRAAGVPLRLIAMDDETEPELIASFPASERVSLNVGQIGKMLDTLKAFGAGYALMAGQ